VVAGGATYAHDFADAGAAVAELLAGHGHDVVATIAHPDAIPAALGRHRPDAVVTHMLWWRMLADRYAQWRDEWAYETSDALRAALPAFVAAGGGLVALHTSTISFDDWPGWGDLLGGQWDWDRSFHPPLGPVHVRIADERSHPITAGIGDFDADDEVYANLDLRPGLEPLGFGTHPDGSEHPLLWAWHHGAGRVAVLGLGHDRAALMHPVTAALVVRCTDWAIRSA
jgi:hypothetical protein